MVPVKMGRVGGAPAADTPPEVVPPAAEPALPLDPEPELEPDPEPPDEDAPPPVDEEPELPLDPEVLPPELELVGEACGGKEALTLKLRVTSWLSVP
ncbi:MAG: hypothetical protein WA639_21610 [Candidatus Acidiferrum sp.]